MKDRARHKKTFLTSVPKIRKGISQPSLCEFSQSLFLKNKADLCIKMFSVNKSHRSMKFGMFFLNHRTLERFKHFHTHNKRNDCILLWGWKSLLKLLFCWKKQQIFCEKKWGDWTKMPTSPAKLEFCSGMLTVPNGLLLG